MKDNACYEENSNPKTSEHIVVILYALIMIVLYGLRLGYNVLWEDEAYTAWISNLSIREIVYTTANDVHPPLYYLIVKGALLLFGDSVYVYRGVSYVTFLFMIAFSVTVVRRKWGSSATILMITFLSVLKNTFIQNVEIRMYSLALMLVFLSFYFVLRILETGKLFDYIGFSVTTLAAAYTHYYALVTVGIIAFLLISYCLLIKYNVKKVLIAESIAAILYLPWFVVLYRTFRQKKDDYWIQTIPSFGECMGYIYNSNVYLEIILIALTLLVILLTLYFTHNGKEKTKDKILSANLKQEEEAWILMGIIAVVGTAIIGIGVSKIFRPLFQEKYMYPCIGIAWTILIVCIGHLNKSKIFRYSVALITLVVCIPICLNRLDKEHLNDVKQNETLEKIAQFVNSDTLIYCIDNSVSWRNVLYYYPQSNVEEISSINDASYEERNGNKLYLTRAGEDAPDGDDLRLVCASGRIGITDVDVYYER